MVTMLSRVVPLNDAQLRIILKKFDVDGAGRLDKKQLKQVFQHLGVMFPGWRAFRAVSLVDSNGDGFISDEEMNDLVKYIKKMDYTLKEEYAITTCNLKYRHVNIP